jgi:hypothetical protein
VLYKYESWQQCAAMCYWLRSECCLLDRQNRVLVCGIFPQF